MKKWLLVIASSCFIIACNKEAEKKVENKKDFGTTLFNDSILHKIEITFETDSFVQELIASKEHRREDKYLVGHVKVDGQDLNYVGIRYKGESSYKHYPGNKKSFKIKFDKYVKCQEYDGLSGINLNNNFKDPTMMREKLMLDMAKDINLPAQRAAYAQVFINGANYGVYTMLELIDKTFLKQNFGTAKGQFYQGEPLPEFTYISDDEKDYHAKYRLERGNGTYDDILSMIKSIKEKGDLSANLYVDEILRSFALNNVAFNIDAYNMHYPHNFYLFNEKNKGKFHWINYDYNYAFGTWSPLYKYDEMVEYPLTFVDTMRHPQVLTHHLLNNNLESYKREVDSILAKVFNEDYISEKLSFYNSIIFEQVKRDSMKMFSTTLYEKNRHELIGDKNDPGAFYPGILEFVRERRAFLKEK